MNSESQHKAAIEEHWEASESGDTVREHAIYSTDAALDYPQSGDPADRHFTVLRITGSGDVWVSECIITYDGAPTYSVSVMEFSDGSVIHEAQYFADPFGAPVWRMELAEPMPGRTIARA
jgi:hypothetical protein